MPEQPIWVVGHSDEFLDLVRDVAEVEGITIRALTPEEAHRERHGSLPAAALIDGTDTGIPPGRDFAVRLLDASERVVIATARRPRDLDRDLLEHPKTRLMAKPFALEQFEAALRWLGGREAGDGWYVAPEVIERDRTA
jgi:DNA-binding response OmpR family regulator